MTLEMDEIDQIEEKIITAANQLEGLIMKSHSIPHDIWTNSILMISKCLSNIDTNKYRVFNTKKNKGESDQNMDLTQRAIRLLDHVNHCLPPIEYSKIAEIKIPEEMSQDFLEIRNAFSGGLIAVQA